MIQLREPIQVPSGTEGCVSCFGRFTIRGKLLGAETLEPLPDADVIIFTLTDGDETAVTVSTDPDNGPSASDGTFDVMATGFGPCVDGKAELPLPDNVELTVELKDCGVSSSRRRFSIDISAETVVDPTVPDGVLELRDPILVPPCEE